MSPPLPMLGMVNPPRKAKRLREIISKDVPAAPAPASASPQPFVPPPPPPPPPLRQRGRKPAGPLSRAAREQLRKTNHSVIEKRRREKINDALAALRELVPHEKSEAEEKEFKLEVLVRTVEYLRMMVSKVRKLEEQACSKCGVALAAAAAPSSSTIASASSSSNDKTGGKRKRPVDENLDADFAVDVGGAAPETRAAPRLPATPSSGLQSPPTPSSLPRLPSISSWLRSSPRPSPIFSPHPFHTTSPSFPFQLPSPPQSTSFAPTRQTDFLPRLSLPPGIQMPIPPVVRGRTDNTNSSPPHGRDALQPIRSFYISGTDDAPRSSRSPASPWTRDDQTAASLLLNISSRTTEETTAQTPSSVLGMGDGQ